MSVPERFYIADVIGTGTLADPWRPAVRAIIAGVRWIDVADLRAIDDVNPNSGRIVGFCPDVSDADHATLSADPRVTVVPFENAQGAPLGPSAKIGDLSAAKQSALATRLEAAHIPIDDLTPDDPLTKVLARVARRREIRHILGASDFVEGLDTLVSAIPAARRNTIAAILRAKEFDTSVIVGPDTIRQALKKLLVQKVPLLVNRWE